MDPSRVDASTPSAREATLHREELAFVLAEEIVLARHATEVAQEFFRLLFEFPLASSPEA